VASETCALDQIGARAEREVRPGEAVRLTAEGPRGRQALPSGGGRLCVFESIYFARPDSVLDGKLVYPLRMNLGRELAKEHPAPDADLVVGLPDSGTPAATVSPAPRTPTRGVVRNRYVGGASSSRTRRSVQASGLFNPLRSAGAGRRRGGGRLDRARQHHPPDRGDA
jgi:amidophosphoribosyltransferase